MHKLSDNEKIDIAIAPASNGTGEVTSRYYDMSKYRKALFVAQIGAMAAGNTSALQIMQARNAAADGAKVLTNAAATVTANTKVTIATIVMSGLSVDDTVTINGIVFTAKGATDADEREFINTGNNDAAAALVLCVNHATMGVPGVTATASTATVTLVVDDPGSGTLTIAASDATNTIPATVSAVAYLECDVQYLDTNDGFSHVAIRMTNAQAALNSGVALIRGNGRYMPSDQHVAAAKTDVSA